MSGPMTGLDFQVSATDGRARRGRIITAHGVIDTPAFMPVGTAATVKAMTPEAVAGTGAQCVLANTYHLMLRPGSERIERLGGLHGFMNWPGPILTDSGGYQVWSLAKLRTVSDAGVEFRSHIDGTRHMLSPESAIDIQRQLGTDIAMVLDECTAYPVEKDEAARSLERSMTWAGRCRAAFEPTDGRGLFGIVQGGMFEDLRARSAEALKEIGFDGYALGGLSVGEGQAEMFRVLEAAEPHLPTEKPRYLMGVGKPEDLIGSVVRGIDMFDCVLPTRSGRTDQAFTRRGTINMRNARHRDDRRPIDPDCACYACAHYSRAYIAHLSAAKEILGMVLLTGHNLHYYQELMAGLRGAIETGTLNDFAAGALDGLASGDMDEV